MAGNTYSFGEEGTGQNLWLMKLDEAGAVEWETSYGGPTIDTVESVRQTRDLGYVMAGSTYSFGAGGNKADLWVLKLDSLGGIVWERAYGGSAGSLVLQALASRKASPQELAEIRQLLNELEGGEP